MAVTYLCGFETGSIYAEPGLTLTNTTYLSEATSPVKYGSRSMFLNGSPGSSGRIAPPVSSGWVGFWYRLYSAGQTDNIVVGLSGGLNLHVGASQLLEVRNGATVIGTGTTAMSNSTWHYIGFAVKPSYTGVLLQVDGNDEVSGTTPASATMSLGAQDGTYCGYIDDLVIDDAAFPSATTRVALLVPISDYANTGDVLWRLGNGSAISGNGYLAVDNIPPAGVASASETATSNIEHPGNSSTGGCQYQANLTTYASAGIASGDTVLALWAFFRHGEDVSTGTKPLRLQLVSNPTHTVFNMSNAGNDGGAHVAETGVWVTSTQGNGEAPLTNPSVTLSASPVLAAERYSTETRVACVDFMGAYVAWTPASGTPKSASDSGTGSDTSTGVIIVTTTEPGTGADAVSQFVAVLDPCQDTGTGSDPPATVDQGATAKSATDAGVGADTSSSLAPSATAETGAGSDVSALAHLASRTEAGTGADVSTSVAQTTSDAGTGTDAAAISVPIAATDAGAGADSATLAAAPATTDSGAGADTSSPPAAADTRTEAGTGSDSVVSVGLGANDAGTGTDTSTSVGLVTTEAGAGADTRAGLELTTSEAGTGSDLLNNLDTGAVAKSAADAGSAADSSGVAAADTRTESGQAADTSTLATDNTRTEAGTGADASSSIALGARTDAGTGTDTATLDVPLASSDAGAGADASGTAAADSRVEAGAAADTAAVAADQPVSDAGSATEAASVAQGTQAVSASDAGAGAESAATIGVTSSDGSQGGGVDYWIRDYELGVGQEVASFRSIETGDFAFGHDSAVVPLGKVPDVYYPTYPIYAKTLYNDLVARYGPLEGRRIYEAMATERKGPFAPGQKYGATPPPQIPPQPVPPRAVVRPRLPPLPPIPPAKRSN